MTIKFVGSPPPAGTSMGGLPFDNGKEHLLRRREDTFRGFGSCAGRPGVES